MRISAKGRYGLAALVHMAAGHESGRPKSVIDISTRLGISKIYLEQVFAQLKKSGLLQSVKGAQGGYRLARAPREISVLEILGAVDQSLFEPTGDTVREQAPGIEAAMRSLAFDALDSAVAGSLGEVTLQQMADEAQQGASGYMFYI